MQSRFVSLVASVLGVVLIVVACLPGSAVSVSAAPLLVADTPTTEPPTPTPVPPTPSPTPVPPSATPTPPPVINTPVVPPPPPTNTPVPESTRTPAPTRPPSDDDNDFADPAITKTVNAPVARIGDTLVFNLAITNLGNVAAENVTVTDTLPDQLDIVEATTERGTVTTSGRSITALLGTVQPGEVINVRIVARVNESAQPGELSNTGIVSTTTPGDNPNNNTSTVVVRIIVEQAATPSPTAEGAPSPTPTPLPPARLPGTGSEQNTMPLFVLGMLLLVGGLIVGRRAFGKS